MTGWEHVELRPPAKTPGENQLKILGEVPVEVVSSFHRDPSHDVQRCAIRFRKAVDATAADAQRAV